MSRRVESVEDLAEMVREDPELAQEIRERPAETIAEMASPLERDPWIYRIVVITLGLVAVVAITGSIAIVIAAGDEPVPDAVVALGSAAVGALAGLIAPQHGRR